MLANILLFLTISFCAGSPTYESKDVNKIINGNIAADFQFPFMVSIQQVSQLHLNTRGHKCGGALINYQHVLTAASCFVNYVPANSGQYRVFAGSANLTNDALLDRIRFISNVTIHPQYIGPPAYVNNIAIIRLQTPFSSSIVSPISLPATNFVPADSSLCTVAGWGASNTTVVASTQLRYVNKLIYNQNLCTSFYNIIPYITTVTSSMVCTTVFNSLSSGCFGDEGNALVCNGTLTGTLFLTNNCQASAFPEVYTRVSNYTTWVRSVTGGSFAFRPDIMTYIVLILLQITGLRTVC